jgi:cytidylate kinase
MTPIIIAIDGYSSTGKSTMAKALAKALQYTYIDTGAMYRAISLHALRKGYLVGDEVCVDDLIADLDQIEISFVLGEGSTSEVCLNGERVESEIRGMEVSNCVSKVSAIPEVRELLVAQQQLMGQKKGVVMDGRDIGSVVFPNAELKLFMTASEEIRVQRRYDELLAKGDIVKFEEVKANISDRDYRDTHRETAPLIQTDDAIVLDNSNLTPKEQLAWVLEKVDQITSVRK